MKKSWILQTKETRRFFSNSTWIPLRASDENKNGNINTVGYLSDFFGCGSVAFPPEQLDFVEKNLSWNSLGISYSPAPFAYKDGYYASIEQFQYYDKKPIGVNLVFVLRKPVIGGEIWTLNPDIVTALRLIKEGNNWVRPEENFDIVIREHFDENGTHSRIEIKREYLLDYLAARNLHLRISYYRQRVENIISIENSQYAELKEHTEERDGGQYSLLIRKINDIFGGNWAMLRAWRTDIDEDEDAPVMGPETNENTDYEQIQGYKGGYEGVQIEGEFWRDEWINHKGVSTRVRGDTDKSLPSFIIETDGSSSTSAQLNHEDIGRWLWFRPSVINELLNLRGFSLDWYTSETGGILSTSGYSTHFGLNRSDLITIYAYDVARLPAWEQRIWAAHNTAPEGKISSELLDAQVKTRPASTRAAEKIFFLAMDTLEDEFNASFKTLLFTHKINTCEGINLVSRFNCKDQASLLRLAKDLIRLFSDRLNVQELRKISTHRNKDSLGSNKLLENILAQRVGSDKARRTFSQIAGAYDMRVGDAHPTSSSIDSALKLAGIDSTKSYIRQGEQLILNFANSIYQIRNLLFETNSEHNPSQPKE